jgi:hypothetical protein
MRNREQMRTILQNQIQLWSAKPLGQRLADLKEVQNYQVVADSVVYQIEVDLLENTEEYVHVGIAVDDGLLPSSIFPVSDSFILKKDIGRSAKAAIGGGSQP